MTKYFAYEVEMSPREFRKSVFRENLDSELTAAVRMPRHNSGRFDKNNFGCLEISLQRAETIVILNDAETIQFIPLRFVALYRAQILVPVKFASLFVVAFNSYRDISVAKLSLVIRLKANALGRRHLAIQFRFVLKVLKKIKRNKLMTTIAFDKN